jgi:hypothetical protein
MTTTLFSWGYWGWGNATERLIEAIDAAEKVRGFFPPLFVDIRLRRQGRAKGFVGSAFCDLLGESRYRWMQDLGNAEIATGTGGITIKRPAAVADLLDLALEEANRRRRTIFYCACEFLWVGEKRWCHRDQITELLLVHAQRIGRSVLVVEWPGGQPAEAHLTVDRKLFSALMHSRKSVPIDDRQLQEFTGLPWGSLLTLQCENDGGTGVLAVGPARFAASKTNNGFWYLPVIEPVNPELSKDSLRLRAGQWRKARGLQERRAL